MALTKEQMDTLKSIQVKRNAVASATSDTTTQPQQTLPERGFRDKAKDFIGGAVYGFSAPGRTIQNLASKGVDKLFGTKGFGEATRQGFEKTTTADLDTTSGKVGEFAGEVGTFIAPGSMASTVSRNLPVLAKYAIQGATSFAQQSLNEGEINKSSIAAGLTDAAFPVAGKFLDVGKTMLKGITGGMTGTGVDVIEAALQRPGAAWSAAGKDVTQGIKELSSKIRTGVATLYKKAGEEYAKKVAEAGVKQIPRNFVVDGVKNRIADLADASIKNGELVLKNTPLTASEESQLQKVFNVVNEWEDFTPSGINTLARRVSRFRRGAVDSANFDRIIDVTKREIRDFVGNVEPKIKEANQAFADKMDLLDEIDNVLRTDSKFSGREGIRKTAESLGRIFNSGKEFTREAIEDLEKELGIDIIGTLAGQQLTDTAARSTARLAGPIETSINAVSGPVARNLVPLAGAVQKQLIDRISNIPGVSPTARAAIVNTFAEFFSEEEQ